MALTTSSRRSFASFDKRSVLLFAALSLGGAAALHAQQQHRTGAAPGASLQSSSEAVIGPTLPALPTEQADSAATQVPSAASQAAFERADANRDGQLNAQEAATLPAIGNRFQELDADRNGMLSRQEFQEGAKP